MKTKNLLIVLALLVAGISWIGYSYANPPLAKDNTFPSVPSVATPSTNNGGTETGTGNTGMKTMQEKCITMMTDMGMPDRMIQHAAEMMDSMSGSSGNMMARGMGMGRRGGCMMGN